ncbi:hypothetical protein QLL95_gp0513 [Cotonvirus japonicus]|uniref:Uncharacterized protein n=1 Tax=Cotonvirus japonicus TaxID=2811091 RepID=A0ABM7NTV6_9VIRU|nr:hypothetical protein QLL95_gp0513 [Cotonvirus japonicus]BCS83610.1 hypothetical protein [Cotonvirus japonicus]
MKYIFTILVIFSLAIYNTGAQPFTGSPIIEYNKPFVIYSTQWNSYCKIPLNSAVIQCDIGLTNPAQATKFAINDGNSFGYPSRTGPVISNSATPNILYETFGSWNQYQRVATVPVQNNPPKNIMLNFQQSLTTNPVIFQFKNNVQQSDGYLHGNSTQVNFRDITQSSGWCSAQPNYYSNTNVECNRAVVLGYEIFNFVPYTQPF